MAVRFADASGTTFVGYCLQTFALVGFVVRFFLREEEITRVAILLTPLRG